MLSATQLKEFAQLSQATYAHFDTNDFVYFGGTAESALQNLQETPNEASAFCDKEAKDLTSRYEILHQSEDNADSNGFSATLFRDKQNGHLVLGFRGTEFDNDKTRDLFYTDLRIGIDGYASPQAIAEYRYIKQLMTAGNQSVQYSAQELENLEKVYWDYNPIVYSGDPEKAQLEHDSQVAVWNALKARIVADEGIDAGQGTTPLISSVADLSLTGHSLGGHLAMLATRLFPELANVPVVTVNAPGFFSSVDTVLPSFSSGFGTNITRVESVGDGVSEIGGTFPGTTVTVGMETRPGVLDPFMANHSCANIADGLKLAELFGKLDRRYADDVRLMKPLFNAAASTPISSYETLLDGLRKVFLGPDTPPTIVETNGQPQTRDDYYQKINYLAENERFATLAGKVTIELSSAELAGGARDTFSNLLSLLTLSPCVIKATAGNEETVEATLRSNWQTEYTAWQTDAEHIALERAAGRGVPDDLNYSGQYLKDRAAMLGWLVKGNQQDAPTSAMTVGGQTLSRMTLTTTQAGVSDIWQFIDAASQRAVEVAPVMPQGLHKVYFGDDGNNTFAESDASMREDYLYGGRGNDTLYGGQGRDYLEGNDDADSLIGGSGQDTLIGGTGNDTLEGGIGYDLLQGGTGEDTYKFATGDGWDWIEDADGLGRITVDGVTLGQGPIVWKAPNVWQEKVGDQTFTYSLCDGTEGSDTHGRLSIQGTTGGIWVKNWQAGQLGITLPGAVVVAPPLASSTFVGDHVSSGYRRPAVFLTNEAPGEYIGNKFCKCLNMPAPERTVEGEWTLVGLYEHLVLEVVYEDDYNCITQYVSGTFAYHMYDKYGNQKPDELVIDNPDLLSGSPGNDLIQGLGGNDWISGGGGGNDVIDGGKGSDRLSAGRDSTTLIGGSDSDILIGDAGDDVLFAETQIGLSEAIELGETQEGLYGKGDWLSGRDGDDKLIGSSNDDALFGGRGNDVIVGGAGNDELDGDNDFVPKNFNWTASALPNVFDRWFEPVYDISGSDRSGGNDILFGGAGNDHIFGATGNDLLYGGTGNDTLAGGEGDDVLQGGSGNDVMAGDDGYYNSSAQGDDVLNGGEGNDWLQGEKGNDQLFGDAGDDVLLGGQGDDLVSGGAGDDALFGDATGVFIEDGWRVARAVTIDGAERLYAYQFQASGIKEESADIGDDLIDGGDGNDWVFGGAGRDTLIGERGGDVLFGGLGEDLLSGGADDDDLCGGGGADTIYGDEGNDYIFGDGEDVPEELQSADYLDGGEGDDYLRGYAGNDTLIGGEGRDVLFAEAGNDLLIGGSDEDTLNGGGGDDTLIGGSGADALAGGSGNDTYVFESGDGVPAAGGSIEAISEESGDDTVRFDGVSASSLSVTGYDDGLLVINYGAGDQLGIEGGTGGAIERFVVDGVSYSTSELIGRYSANVTRGTDAAGNAVVFGGSGADSITVNSPYATVSGGRGDDTITSWGETTFIYARGDGKDHITVTPGGNVLRFGAGIEASDLKLIGTPLVLQVGPDATDVLTFDGFDAADLLEKKPFERVEFSDGSQLTFEELVARGFDLNGTAGDDVIRGTAVVDRIAGGTGNDTLNGGAGNDTYSFNLGDGEDRIFDTPGANRVRFGAGLDAATMAVEQHVADDGGLYLDLSFAGGDVLRIRDGETGTIAEFEFSNGEILSYRDIVERLPHVVSAGSAGNDTIWGGAGDDTLHGAAGNDRLFAGNGDDYLDGGAGNDTLHGGAGTDVYRINYGMGWDTIVEEAGDTSILRLEGALVAGALQSSREGNDLLIGTAEGADGVRIQDYFVGEHDWRVETATGEHLGMTAFLGTLGSWENGYGAADALKVFYQQQVACNFASLLSGQGYYDGGDGRFYRDTFSVSPFGMSETHSTAHLSFTEATIQPSVGDDGRDRYAQYYNIDTQMSSLVTSEFINKRAERPINVVASEVFGGSGPIFIPYAGTGYDTAVSHTGGSAYSLSDFQQVYKGGQLIGAWYYPPGWSYVPTGADIQSVAVQNVVNRYAYDVTAYELHASAGDDLVFGHGYGVFDLDKGNDEVWIDDYDSPTGNGSLDYVTSEGSALFGNELGVRLGALLDGGDGDDALHGGNDRDILAGGNGNNFLDGRRGGDTYVVFEGAGVDLITDTANLFINQELWEVIAIADHGTDVVVLPVSASRDRLQLSWGEALVSAPYFDEARKGNAGWSMEASPTLRAQTLFATLDIRWGTEKTVRIVMPHTEDLSGSGIEEVQLGDGTRLSLAELIALAPPAPTFDPHQSDNVITGTGSDLYAGPLAGAGGNDRISGNGWLDGGDGNDVLLGGRGFDRLEGGDGDDTLDGGAGAVDDADVDVLIGGKGSDVYVYSRGSGNDLIRNEDDSPLSLDAIELRGLTQSEVQVAQFGADLALIVRDTEECLIVERFFDGDEFGIDEIRFSDGSVWNRDLLLRQFGNQAPSVSTSISDQNVHESSVFTWTVPSDAFTEVDADDRLDYAVTLSDGAALPSWLSFDAATQTLSGTPAAGDVGSLDLKITATDQAGASASQTFSVTVENLNEAPVSGVALMAQTAAEDAAFSYTLPADAFADADVSDTLNYSLKLANGDPLPNWLTFDAVTRTLSGTPANGDVGVLNLKVTATDQAGASASQTLALTVSDVNDAPTVAVALSGQEASEGNAFTFTLPAATFADVDMGDTLNYTVSLANDAALPSWLTFDAATQTLSGTPAAGDVGHMDVKVTATDRAGASVSQTFALAIAATSGRSLVGTSGNDALQGTNGNDTLDGGLGADSLAGGAGDDHYLVDNVGDVVVEGPSAGNDTVRSSVTWTLPTNVENLLLTGTAAINGTGNDLANSLVGNSGSNVLNGAAGADTLTGGLGNDTYIIDDVGDIVIETAGEGTDTVQSSITWVLGANVENITLTGMNAVDATGNAWNNTLTGNNAANVLTGGLGNDTYVVNTTADSVVENANEGTDTIRAAVSWTLGDNVENLTLLGMGALNGTGNALNNILTGTSGANLLVGGAGDDTLNGYGGVDTLIGGLGNDTFYVDSTDDVVVEAAGEGAADRIISSINYTLGENFEKLSITDNAQYGVGNAVGNEMWGNAGNNLLVGLDGNDTIDGSNGNDILEGGNGNDWVTDIVGAALFDGGAGNDTLVGGGAPELYLGGTGNDSLTTGGGKAIILFNKGDGQDLLTYGGTGSDTLSLGGGISYGDLSLAKSGNHLVLSTGNGDQITFQNWYATTPSKPVVNLQVIAEAMDGFVAGGSDSLKDQKIENFNFTGLVSAFDTARAADTTLTAWALTNALAQCQLTGSDTAALGGDLAYQYGKNGTLAGIGLTAAQDVIGNANFGSQAQTLRPLETLQTGSVRLG